MLIISAHIHPQNLTKRNEVKKVGQSRKFTVLRMVEIKAQITQMNNQPSKPLSLAILNQSIKHKNFSPEDSPDNIKVTFPVFT